MDRQVARAIRVRRENVFYLTRFLSLIILGVSALGIAQQMTGDRWSLLRLNIYLLIVVFWQWSTSVATWACRQLGLSLDGQVTEKVERVDYVPPDDQRPGEPFTMGRQGAQFIMPVCATLLCLICVGPPLFTRSHTLGHFGHTVFHALIFSALAGAAIFSWLNIRKPLVKVDAQGIAYCDSLGITSQFVAWRKISACDVVRVRNVFGEVIRQSLVLKDAQNKKIVTVWINSSSTEINNQNTERVVNLVRQELTGV